MSPSAPMKKRATSRKITRGLVTLSSAAIIAVYGAGYLRTQAAAAQIAAQQSQVRTIAPITLRTTVTPAATVATSTTTPVPTTDPSIVNGNNALPQAAPAPISTVPATPTVPASALPSPTATTAPATRYKDGTFVGEGNSRHGGVRAQVIIKGGKIVSAAILGCSTRYPCSVIDPLPPEVVSQQSTNVDMVSGASDSSAAYLEAVGNALAKAG